VIKNIIKLLNSYNLQAFVCGGTARDLYLNRTPYNLDIAVNADLATLRNKLATKIVNINDYSASILIKYKDTIYTLYPLKKIELLNTYYNYSFTNSIEEDSKTRDFTINALYYNPLTEEWFDFHNSINDLNNKIIRFVGNPATRILESKIRILRAPILSAILGEGWVIDSNSCDIINEHKLKTAIINPRQINNEIEKLLSRADVPSKAFKLFRFLGLLEDFFPELNRCIGIEQSNKAVGLDLFHHIMYAIDSIDKTKPNALIIKVAALLHDIGKPYTEIKIEDSLHFYNHENVGAYLTEKILYRWGFNKQFINKIVLLVQNHLFDAAPNKSNTSIKKLIQKIGANNIHDLLDLRIADRLGTGRKNISLNNIYNIRDKINIILGVQNLDNFKLAISDAEIKTDVLNYTEFINETVIEIKNYLSHKILSSNLQNKPPNLKRAVNKIIKIDYPLDKTHLFKTWTKLQNESADTFPDKKLKCGIFCNFLCNRKLETDYKT